MPAEKQQSLNNPLRLEALRRSQLLDGAATPMLDRLTRIASALLDVPISLVSLVDNAGQHFPGLTGLTGWAGDRRGTALSHSFCQHVVMNDAPVIIEDALRSPVVADNLAISRLGVISYVGVPLRTAGGYTLGALCAIDGVPKKWTAEQVAILQDIAALAMAEIEAHATQRPADRESNGQSATCDQMTGLLNSRGLLEYGKSTFAPDAAVHPRYSVVSADIDGFSAFNKTFGYEQGNARIRETGDLLAELAGERGVVARAGVDEFVVVLSGADEVQSHAFVSEVREAFAARNARNALYAGPALTLSIGCATYSAASPLPFAKLLLKAEAEMYRAMDARMQTSKSAVANG